MASSWTHTHDVSLLSSSQQTALPLPRSVKGNRSFANLAKLFGIGSGYPHVEDEEHEVEVEEEDDDEEADAIDEDSLMWDAQVCLSPYPFRVTRPFVTCHLFHLVPVPQAFGVWY